MVVCYGNVQTAHIGPLAKPVESHFLIFQVFEAFRVVLLSMCGAGYWEHTVTEKQLNKIQLHSIIEDGSFQKIWSLFLLLGELMLIQFFTASTNNCCNVLEANISWVKVLFAPFSLGKALNRNFLTLYKPKVILPIPNARMEKTFQFSILLMSKCFGSWTWLIFEVRKLSEDCYGSVAPCLCSNCIKVSSLNHFFGEKYLWLLYL